MGITPFRYTGSRRLKRAVTSLLLASCFLLLASDFLLLTSYLSPLPACAQEPSTLERGIQLLNEKRLDEAIKVFEEAITQYPGDPLLHYYAGVVYHQKHQAGAALAALGNALKLNPGLSQAIFEIGTIFEELGRFDKAREAYKVLAARREETPLLKEAQDRLRGLDVKEHYQKATRLFRENRYEESLKELDDVLSIAPENVEAHFAAGMAYVQLHKPEEAIKAFKKVTEIDPKHLDAHLYLGMAYDSASAYKEAIEGFQKVIALAPASSQAREAEKRLPTTEKRLESRKHFEDIAGFIRKEAWAEALNETRTLLTLEPENPDAFFNLGLILYKLKENDQAIDALKQAIEADPKHQKAFYQLAVIYDDMGQYKDAIHVYEQVPTLDEKTTEAEKSRERYDVLTSLLEGEEKGKEAKELLKKEDVKKEDISNAISELEALISTRKDDPKLFSSLALLYIKGGRLKDAATVLEKVVSLAPKDVEMRFLLAKTYEELHEYRKAVEVYQTVASMEGETPTGLEARDKARSLSLLFHFEEAKRFLEKGDYEGSLQEIQAVLEIDPANPVALFNMGVLYDRLNQPDKAEVPLKKAISISPDYVAALLQLGLVFEKLRRFTEARESFEKVIAIQGKGRETRIARARIGLLQEQEEMSGHLKKAFELLDQGELDAARKEVEAVIARNPRNYIGYYYLGIILAHANITDEAKAALKKAIEINPRYGRSYLQLGDVLVKEGEYEEAREVLRRFIAIGVESPELDMAVTVLKRLKNWNGKLSMTQSFNSNIAFRARAHWDFVSSYHLGLSDILVRRKDWNISAGLSVSESLYYKTQFQGNGYTLSLNGVRNFSGERTLSGALSRSKSYFEGEPTFVSTQLSGTAATTPRSIPTSASLSYNGSWGRSYTNKLSNAEQHNLSVSVSQKLSIRDTLSGSYGFSVYKNLDIIGSNYANRTHSLSVSLGRPLLSMLSGSIGYSISLVNYSNPDSTTLFQRFRRNVNQSLSAALSLSSSDKISLSLNYNFAYAISRTSLPPPTFEELQRLEEILASPIPTVGGGGGYYSHGIGLSLSIPF